MLPRDTACMMRRLDQALLEAVFQPEVAVGAAGKVTEPQRPSPDRDHADEECCRAGATAFSETFLPNEEVELRCADSTHWIAASVVAEQGTSYVVRLSTGATREAGAHQLRRRQPASNSGRDAGRAS